MVECSPATRAARVRFPDDASYFFPGSAIKGQQNKGRPRGSGKEQKVSGDGGYRSPYLSHAKRALYHLSYVPGVVDSGTELEVNHPKVKVTLGELSVASSVALLPAAVHIPR